MHNTIRDLIYFDFSKAASIWSQFEGGLLECISKTEETEKDHTGAVKLGIPHVFEAKYGLEYTNTASVLESKILHHDLLNKIETRLRDEDLVVDLNNEINQEEITPETIRKSIGIKPYILSAGWSVIEDYKRVRSIADKFNKLIEYISKSALENIKKSPEYAELQRQIDEKRKQIQEIQDRNQKTTAKTEIKKIEAGINQILTSQLSQLDEWVIDGIKLWIDTFLANRINFRIYPFESCPSFQIICNLKRDCFVDQDLEHLLYGYGNRPNVPLAVFGLITSLPEKSGYNFDPLKEFESDIKLNDKVAFEKAFRSVFKATDELEDWMRYSRYPNVTIHPIAVFRKFEGKKEKFEDSKNL